MRRRGRTRQRQLIRHGGRPVFVHEFGHLAGHQNSLDPSNVMFPFYNLPIAECKTTPAPASPPPTPPQTATAAQAPTPAKRQRRHHKRRKRHRHTRRHTHTTTSHYY
jgi:hypothetical protein